MSFHAIKAFFVEHGTSVQIFLYAFILVGLWLAETVISLEPWKKKWQHTLVNFKLTLTVLPVQLGMTFILVAVSSWVVAHHWGLVYLVPYHSSLWVKYVGLFIVLDFLDYLYHVTMHRVGAFWMFHLVHHSDLEVDVSTTVREHPGETFLRMCFLTVFVFMCGASFGIILLRQTLQSFSNILSHTSILLPRRTEKVLGWIFITPNLHRVHHHFQKPYTDCNYGDIFSIWDRIFGTFRELCAKDTVFGLDTHMDVAVNGNFIGIIKMPFRGLLQMIDKRSRK